MPFTKDTYRRNKQYVIDYLGGKCEHCGSEDELQFAHVDPSTKVACVTELLSSLDRAVKEADKCLLLCEPCHIRMDYPERRHGTLNMYTRGKCRCVRCRKANADYMKRYRKNRAPKHRDGVLPGGV